MMEKLIEEIADLIDGDEVVYMHRETQEILSHPNTNGQNYTLDLDYLVQEVLDIVDMNPDAYIRFEPLNSKEGFVMMEAFANTITDNRQQEQLKMALSGNKPFRRFRSALEETDLIDPWYDFKIIYLETYVKDKMDEARED